MERFVKQKKKTSYLYLGLGFASAAVIMIVTSVLAIVHGEKISVPATGFGAGIMWAAAAFACIRTYYKANCTELTLFEEKNVSENDDK